MIACTEGAKATSHLYCIRQEHPSYWTVTCLFKKIQACTCICTSMWVAISNICV